MIQSYLIGITGFPVVADYNNSATIHRVSFCSIKLLVDVGHITTRHTRSLAVARESRSFLKYGN